MIYRADRLKGQIRPRLQNDLLTLGEAHVLKDIQSRQAGMTPTPDKFALGNILLAGGQITRSQLDNALLRQRASGRLLGEELIDAGHANRGQIERGLLLQKKLIAYALTLAVGPALRAKPNSSTTEDNDEQRTLRARH